MASCELDKQTSRSGCSLTDNCLSKSYGWEIFSAKCGNRLKQDETELGRPRSIPRMSFRVNPNLSSKLTASVGAPRSLSALLAVLRMACLKNCGMLVLDLHATNPA